jgi:hypothetical protein
LRRSRRRSRARARRAFIVLGLLAFSLVSAYELGRFVGVFKDPDARAWCMHPARVKAFLPAPDYRAARGVYPYSVVPGGARDEAELAAAAAKDPAVAAHYRDIPILRLHPTRLNTPISVYASYRLNDSVYWTKHKIYVPKGELILTNGFVMVRARCGNRLAFTPPFPSLPSPPLPSLAAGPPELPPVEPPDLVFEYGMPPLFAPPPPAPPVSFPSFETANYWPPPKAAVPWCCAVGGFVPGSLGGLGNQAALLGPQKYANQVPSRCSEVAFSGCFGLSARGHFNLPCVSGRTAVHRSDSLWHRRSGTRAITRDRTPRRRRQGIA